MPDLTTNAAVDNFLASSNQTQMRAALDLPATYQPLDSDLTAIAALTTTAFGRALLELADATGLLAATGIDPDDYQPVDPDLTAIAALSTTGFGRALLELADAAALRTAAGLGSLATLNTIGSAQITDGAIVDADINTGAAIALSKLATDPLARANHTGTQAASTITGIPVEICVACSDETTALTAAAGKVTFRAPFAFTLSAVRASVNAAPTGAAILVDINEAGVSLLSTKLMIDATEKTSTTATTAYVISDTSIADDAEITIDIDQIGSTIAGAGLKVWLLGTRV